MVATLWLPCPGYAAGDVLCDMCWYRSLHGGITVLLQLFERCNPVIKCLEIPLGGLHSCDSDHQGGGGGYNPNPHI